MFTSSLKYAVSDFIFISADKAVNPVNNMGLSKMLAELFLKSNFNNKKISTKIIRFGNVINSNGSVIPIFLDAIYNGSAIEIRNEAVERYFIYDDVVAKNILNISIHDSNSLYFTIYKFMIKSFIIFYNINYFCTNFFPSFFVNNCRIFYAIIDIIKNNKNVY